MASNSSLNEQLLMACTGMKTGVYFWMASSLICCVVGLPASFVILWDIFKAHRTKSVFTSVNLFVLNLSIMDIIFLLFLPIAVMNEIYFNDSLGRITNLVYALNLCGRPLLMACMCVDFYVAIVHPIFYHRMRTATPRVVGVLIVWVVTLITGGLYFHFYTLYLTFFSTVYFIIAMVIIGICDAFIMHALVAPAGSSKGVHPQKKRAIQIIINSLVVTSISYLPPVLFFIFGLHLISDERVFMCTIAIPVAVTSTLGSAVMPVLFLNNLGKFDCLWVRCK